MSTRVSAREPKAVGRRHFVLVRMRRSWDVIFAWVWLRMLSLVVLAGYATAILARGSVAECIVHVDRPHRTRWSSTVGKIQASLEPDLWPIIS